MYACDANTAPCDEFHSQWRKTHTKFITREAQVLIAIEDNINFFP